MIRAAGPFAAAATVLLAASQCAPPAAADQPPVIDNSRLPAPTPPAPPEPSELREPCSVPLRAEADHARPGQLDGVDLTAMWRLSRGAGQRVAVIDTGVAPHRRLAGVVGGGDYVSDGDGRADCDGHGTMVAGIIAAAPDPSDRSGFSGVAPEATIIAIRQSSNKFGPASEPSSRGFGDVTTLAMAVRTAADLGASVINISSVACAEGMLDDRVLGAALSYAVDVKDAVVVAAAGNVGGPGQCPAQNTASHSAVASSPAWYDDYVLAVGSVGADGAPSRFSLNGPWVDVAAHGEAVVSLDRGGDGVVDTVPGETGAAPISGTSYAAPVVSGLVALVRARFPRMSARQVMARIEATAHRPARGWDPQVGNGIVDGLAALSDHAAAPPQPRPLSPPPAAPARRESAPAARGTAVAGVGLCLAGLLAAGSARLRRRRHSDVAGD